MPVFTRDYFTIDYIQEYDYPLILVASSNWEVLTTR